MAAIITTQTDRNQPKVPSAVQGPSSMPCIWAAVHHQPIAASTTRPATSPRWPREAAKAGRRPVPAEGPAAVIASGAPGEVGLRQPGLSLELDAERADA